jgi:hypothetical protein
MTNTVKFTLDNFDPNKIPGLWATVVIDHGGTGFRFKTYTKRMGALNKVRHNANSALFEWDVQSHMWVERARHPSRLDPAGDPTRDCEKCFGPIQQSGNTNEYGRYEWDRWKNKIVDPPRLLWVCTRCYAHMNGFAY